MSLYDYRMSSTIDAEDYPFYSLIMSAMKRADPTNLHLLKVAWPEVWRELDERYHAAGGFLGGEEGA